MRASRLAFAGLRRVAHSSVGGALPLTAAVAAAAAAMPLTTQLRFASSKNPYTVLGIKQGADKAEIKKAYRVLARKHHPDAPGGSDEKFREVQEAYEQIKSGVWIRKEQEGGSGSGDGGGGSTGNRYSGFRYTTRTHSKSKVSYDQFYEEMHTGRVKKDPFADDDEPEDPAAKDPRRNPFAMNELAFQAWMRFIILWCVVFSSCRFGLFLLFPPKWEKPQRKPPPRELRGQRKPAPKPIHGSDDAIVA